MNFESTIEELVSAFPLLQTFDGYAEALGLPHAMFGSVFCPWLERLLTSAPSSATRDDDLTAAFRFIERMLQSNDERVQEVALVTVLNYLVDYCGRNVVAPWCGPLAVSWLDRLPPG